MCFQSLAVAFVFNVPDSQRLVVRHADYVFTTGVKQQSTDPVVMANLHTYMDVWCQPATVIIKHI